jgi:hypothetical protein
MILFRLKNSTYNSIMFSLSLSLQAYLTLQFVESLIKKNCIDLLGGSSNVMLDLMGSLLSDVKKTSVSDRLVPGECIGNYLYPSPLFPTSHHPPSTFPTVSSNWITSWSLKSKLNFWNGNHIKGLSFLSTHRLFKLALHSNYLPPTSSSLDSWIYVSHSHTSNYSARWTLLSNYNMTWLLCTFKLRNIPVMIMHIHMFIKRRK